MKKNNSNEKEEKTKKKKIDGYITINNMINEQRSLANIINNSGIEDTIKKMKSMIMPTELYIKSMNHSLNSLHEKLQKIAHIIKPITETVINYQIRMTPYFKELGEVLQKAKENPDSLMNWINYCEKLEEYIWTFPFDMKSEELKDILERVNSEEEFDRYMIKYFDKISIPQFF